MISIEIGPDKRDFQSADRQWLHEAIDGRRRDGVQFQVVVTVDAPSVDLLFCIPPPLSKRKREQLLSEEEARIVEQWKDCGLNSSEPSADALCEFLGRISNYA